MKTKKKFESGLYKQAKLDHSIAIAMYIVLGVGILVDVAGRIMGIENHLDITAKWIAYTFLVTFCSVTMYHFNEPSDMDKEKEKMLKTLESLKKDHSFFVGINEEERDHFGSKISKRVYYKKMIKVEQKIWKLEWQLKQMGEN